MSTPQQEQPDLPPVSPESPQAEASVDQPNEWAQNGGPAPEARVPSRSRRPLSIFIRGREQYAVFLATFVVMAFVTPRMVAYLNPTTGDEPFYLMTATSIWRDHDINECNNYRQRDETALYPANVPTRKAFPYGWTGWTGAPFPLPPHAAKIEPVSRRCLGTEVPGTAIPSAATPLPDDGTQSELYSKHGLGLSLLVTLPFALGGRVLVVLFLNALGALLAANIYLLARSVTRTALPAVLTWVAFALTVPIFAYSFLIFPELPAALLVVYSFRRIMVRRNNFLQWLAVGLAIGFLPWLHYRFAPVSAALVAYALFGLYRDRARPLNARTGDFTLLFAPAVASALMLMTYFYFLYRQPFPSASDHAGISDFAGTMRGVVGSFIDEQWGLFVAAPIFILAVVGVILMAIRGPGRGQLIWIALVFLPYFGLVANYAQWWGEWCPPARYLTSVLPLLAVPFAYALDRIRNVGYYAVYAVLLLLSVATTAGYIIQPQLMYNQPNGKSQLFLNGVPELLKLLPAAVRPQLDLVAAFPSFVIPYFGYLYQGQGSGEYWSARAWEKSVWPIAAILAIVALSLIFAWWHARRGGGLDSEVGRGGSVDTESDEQAADSGEPEAQVLAPGPVTTARYRTLSGLIDLIRGTPLWRPACLPAAAGAGFAAPSLRLMFSLPPWGATDAPIEERAPDAPAIDQATEGQDESVGGNGHDDEQKAMVPPEYPVYRPPLAGRVAGTRARGGRSRPGLLGALWRTRGLVLGVVGLGLALYGQKLVVDHAPMTEAIRWYAAGILVALLGWLGTYNDRRFVLLHRPSAVADEAQSEVTEALSATESTRRHLLTREHFITASRYLLALLALGLNVFSVNKLRLDYYSEIGGWGWLASLVLLFVAFIGYRPRPGLDADAGRADVEDKTDWRLPRRWEAAVITGIFVLALALRLYRLGDWTTGVHGDEGEAGADALRILEGNLVSPFLTGWFQQPNFYYWAIALTMKVFGTDLFGLRMFSALAGSLLVLPVYGLARHWFGLRTAVLAGVFLAMSDVAIHFSKAEFSNITTPLFLCAGFYVYFVALKSRRVVLFVLAGYSFMLSMYFYLGGRLTPFLVAGVVAYMFILTPLLSVPGLARKLRRAAPGMSLLRALGRAARTEALGVRDYVGHLVVLAIACFMMASPFLFYYLDHRAVLDARSNEKLIFNQEARMVEQHHATHDPLYLGLRAPAPDDIYPLGVVFEQTSHSLKLADDGFWPRAIWSQLVVTLSILTYRFDASSVYTFTGAPVAKPIEAVLIILGIAWALWRWRDARMAVLSIWFWATVFVGGVLTIDAPYMARLVGIIPCMAIFAAIVVNKLMAEGVGIASLARRRPRLTRRLAAGFAGAAAFALLAFLLWQNYTDYFIRYMNPYPSPEVTGQALFVRQARDQAQAEGRPAPTFYSFGVPFIFWGHGTNRFLNHDAAGKDVTNPSDVLPITDSGKGDAIFLVWTVNAQYLALLNRYYPGGETKPFNYSADGKSGYLFTSYRVKHDQIEATRRSLATYTPASGRAIQRLEGTLGTSQAPPGGLTYPVRAEWAVRLVAPAFARYRFELGGVTEGGLEIDGVQVLTRTNGGPPTSGEVLLARGPHDVRLVGTMLQTSEQVQLMWSAGSSAPRPIAPQYLYAGNARALTAEVRPFIGDIGADIPPDSSDMPVFQRRVDGFLGFKSTPEAMMSGPMSVRWLGTLHAPETGKYTFDIFSSGGSMLLIDGRQVVINPQPAGDGSNGHGEIELAGGAHSFELRYNWQGGPGVLEANWTQPNGKKAMLDTGALTAQGGAWLPGAITEPQGFVLPSDDTVASLNVKPDKVFPLADEITRPRGIAVDSRGNIYVGDRGHNRVAVYSPDGRPLRSMGKAPADPQNPGKGEIVDIADVAVGPDGSVYVLDPAGLWLNVFDAEGKLAKAYDARKLGLFSPNGIFVASSGAVYIADTGQSRILELQTGGDGAPGAEFRGSVGIPGAPGFNPLEQPLDAIALQGAASADPSVFAIDLRNRIVGFNAAGEIVKQYMITTGGADGGGRLALSPDGSTAYMSDPDRGQIAVVDLVTGAVTYAGEKGEGKDQLGQVSGVAAGPDGKVYVVDSDKGDVQVYTIKVK